MLELYRILLSSLSCFSRPYLLMASVAGVHVAMDCLPVFSYSFPLLLSLFLSAGQRFTAKTSKCNPFHAEKSCEYSVSLANRDRADPAQKELGGCVLISSYTYFCCMGLTLGLSVISALSDPAYSLHPILIWLLILNNFCSSCLCFIILILHPFSIVC
ncbi:hypothetical protein XELAEV_18044839mg [Xenopus laevis]|uniref:Uncharacterized protein n=1 Tax=Xenopus laevis TaxID=8355 RepID=A0A974BZL1_XENLA|nr:hypothetical protein XELAEV_18044839mg [Xenopus laevis]